jgi:hypothetical protein
MPAKGWFTVFRSIVAPMPPTTQQHEHSPFRRRKSMPFTGAENIKVIVIAPILAARHTLSRRTKGASGGISGIQGVGAIDRSMPQGAPNQSAAVLLFGGSIRPD